MVGYDPTVPVEIPASAYSLASVISGFVTRTVSQPLDVLKIRFQLQVEPIKRCHASKYHGMWHAVGSIYKEEGVTAFWKGHVPAQALSLVYGVVQFGVFEVLTKNVWQYLPPSLSLELRPLTHFTVGMVSGCAATIACQPFDVIRTRFVAQGPKKVYSSVLHAARSIVSNEGARGLYKGLSPTLLQVTPQTGFQFGFYCLFKQMWKGLVGDASQADLLKSLVCGSGAGVCAKVLVYPLDVCKKRLQIQGFEEGRSGFGQSRRYDNLRHCIGATLREEGTRGLFKGLGPSVIKAAVSVGCNFCVYDQCIHLMTALYTQQRC